MPANEIRVEAGQTANSVAGRITAEFPKHGSLWLLTDSKMAYNTAVKAVAIATGYLVPIGVYLGAETFVTNPHAPYDEQDDLKIFLSNRP